MLWPNCVCIQEDGFCCLVDDGDNRGFDLCVGKYVGINYIKERGNFCIVNEQSWSKSSCARAFGGAWPNA